MNHPIVAAGVGVIALLQAVGAIASPNPGGRLLNALAAVFLGFATYYLATGL